ncbi:His-Xaa-Ser system protein HxsD [Algoriphagus sp. 4150]|uniref:His-Xaa-Ser system protein HxsD n=1 Tax=Algoriphagus sp. 4150 TaxID=2817756 RepID=UPI00285A6EFB|nr:His-Xaa-Ser system protein HxsD [Algoriphagus sp. 4150]MDR7128018.1 His-Xaa-Ser system protein HxsD [Algoriphagus sp. 4150]
MDVSRMDESTIKVLIDANLYDLGVVQKTFYWYLKDYAVTVKPIPENNIQIVLQKLEVPLTNSDIENLIIRMKQDLFDFTLRNRIHLETKNVRDLIIAKAFSNSDEFDEIPPGTLRDTVDENKFN